MSYERRKCELVGKKKGIRNSIILSTYTERDMDVKCSIAITNKYKGKMSFIRGACSVSGCNGGRNGSTYGVRV